MTPRLAPWLLISCLTSWCPAAIAQSDAGAEDAGAEDAGAEDAGAEDAGAEVVAVGQGLGLLPGDRSALPSVWVTGPEECPNGAQLVAEVEASDGRLRLLPVYAGPADYVVVFRPWGKRYDVEIRDAAGRVRSLSGDGSGCAELGRATALSLAVLVDDAAHLRASSEEPRSSSADRGPPEPADEDWRFRTGALLGLGGVLMPLPVVGVYGRASGPVEISSWFVYGLGYTKTHGPGQVELGWLALGSEACYLLFDLFGPCGGAWAGRLAASGNGYDRNSSVARWQPGLSFAFRFRSAISEHWEWGFGGAGLVPLTKERITVAGVEGDAFMTRSVYPLVALELGARF